MTPVFSQPSVSSPNYTSAGVSDASALSPLPRLLSLDVLRGIAVLCALFVSIWAVGGFSTNQQNGLLIQSKGWEYRLFTTISLFFEGKMRALISLVFGAGIVLFLLKDQQKSNIPIADFYIRRQLWLMAFGLVNALLLLWTGDVLFHLGIMGILLFPFARLSTRSLMLAALLTTLLYSAKNYWSYADDRKAYRKYLAVTAVEKRIAKDSINKKALPKQAGKDSLSKEQKEDKQAWEGILNSRKYDPKKDEGENKAMRTHSYGKLWNHMLPTLQVRESQWTYRFGIWDFAGMILFGMALLKMGFFSSRFSKKEYLLIGLAGLTAGLLLGWFRIHYNQISLYDYVKYIKQYWVPFDLFFPFERAFMAVGYTGLVLFLIAVGVLKFLWRAFAAVGKMALTNYLFQSIICTLFFTGFGMGYYARLEQHQLYFFAAEVCLVQTALSIFWLRYYQTGPAEWLWRCLIYAKWLPNKIRKTELSEPAVLPLL